MGSLIDCCCDIRLDSKADEPLHLQLKRQLIRRIREMPSNMDLQMPSERALGQALKLNRDTIRHAYAELENDGLVIRQLNNARRITANAKELLTESDLSISEIGETVGFVSSAHFSHVFKKMTGMTPSAYRLSQFDGPRKEDD